MAASATPSAGHTAADAHAGAVSPETPTSTAEPAAEVTASASAKQAASATAVAAPAAAVAASAPAVATPAPAVSVPPPAPAVTAPAPAVVTSPPAPVASATRRFALAVRPQLSQDERHAARENGVRLRGQPAPAEPVAAEVRPQAQATPTTDPVYALVTAPTRLRDDSLVLLTRARNLSGQDAALKSARSDLISAQGLWQAALWPFGSRADAERARVRLASKGLKAQVVEF